MVEESMLRCSCGEPLEPDWDECPTCLKPVVKEQLNCPKCGRNVKAKWKKCPKCKTPLDGWATPSQTSDTGISVEDSSPPAPAVDDGPYLSLKEGEDDDLGYGVEVIINEGDVLDKYTIQGTLGSGGFGSVYLAYDTVLKEKVALKVVVAGESDKAQNAREQIIHEFKLREKITDSSHIVSARDPRTCEHMNVTLVLLPMDLAKDGSFRDWLKKNKSEEARTKEGLKMFRQACLGVKAIHDAGLSHLDIKPENILLVNGTAKIADFGIGRYGASMLSDNPKQVNRQGIGTPQYMSPEQFHAARQKDIGPASDIYSLGVVLYELLDGSLPFDGSSRDEYRQKHLHDNPTEIKGTYARYWGIISRCMAKKSEDRYSSIDQLIGDLDRVAQGASLSVDVSCPECGHINSDTSYDACEKCGSDLPETLFYECRRCMKKLRLDTEICPACGFHVMEYYVLQDRWQRVQKLKDEDPVEAMELLETVLRDGAAEYEEKALALVRDLRKKQSQIRDLIAEADKATADGQPEKALENWRAVLDVVPRHRVALEQIEKLEALIKNFAELLDEAEKLMDQAKFEDADRCLQTCLQLIPQHKKTRNMLEICRQRSQSYHTALNQATISIKQRLIGEAEQNIKAALAQASNSPNALALAEELSEMLEKTTQFVNQAYSQLSHAEFDNVNESIYEIEQLQADNESVSKLKVQLHEIQQAYILSMENAKSAENIHDLGKSVQAVERALELCSQSSEAKSLLKRLKDDQEKAQNLLEELTLLLPAAKFEEAEVLAKQTEKLWTTLKGLKEAKDALVEKRAEYCRHMEASQRAKEQSNLEEALEEVESALTVSPESLEAKKTVKILKERKTQAHNLLREVISAVKAARFEEADTKLLQADDLWPGLDGLVKARADLAKCREEFPRMMLAAREAQVGRDLAKALEAADRVGSICPESKEALALVKSIKSAQSEAEQHLKKAIPAWKAAEFDKARNELSQAEKMWPKVPGLRKAVVELVQAQRRHRLRRIEWSIATVTLLAFVYGTAQLWLTYINRRHAETASEFARKGDYTAAITEYNKCLEIPLLVSRPKLCEQVVKGMASEHKRKQDYDEAVRQCRDLTDASKTDEARLAAQKALSLANTSLEKQTANALMTTITDLEITIRHDDLVKQAQAENNVDRKIELLKEALNAKEVTLTRRLLEQTLEGEAASLLRRAASENDVKTKIGLLQKALQYKEEDYIRREIDDTIRFSNPEQTAVGTVRWYTEWRWVVQDRTGDMYSGFINPETKRMIRIRHSNGVIMIEFSNNKVDNPIIFGSCYLRAYSNYLLTFGRNPHRKILNWSIQGTKHLMIYSLDRVDNEGTFFWSRDDPSLVLELGEIHYGDPVMPGHLELRFEQNPKFRVGRR
jgi:serine/threonine protein kinase/tetratricopeptide (TPR) repeat protein